MDEYAELSFLVTDALTKLASFDTALVKHKKHLTKSMYEESKTASGELRRVYESLTLHIKRKEQHRHIKEVIRANQGLLGSLLTMTDWQSPSYESSGLSQAGIQTGTIYATINDYKRDQHRDALALENAYKKAYVDAPIKFPIQPLATVSGMAAFTTILTFLVLEKKIRDTVIVGRASYFQNKELIHKLFTNLIEVDENDTDAFLRAVETHNPRAVFLDTLGNMEDMTVPDTHTIIRRLAKCKQELYLIIDNSCLSVMYQPLAGAPWKSRLRIIIFESLNKFHQFGMDRVTGGMITASGRDALKLFDWRVHAGTNIPDNTVHSIPTPNRKALTRRMMRIGKNTLYLATAIQAHLDAHPNTKLARIVYPGLPNHPNYAWSGSLPFHGAFFVLAFKPQYQSIAVYKRFVSLAITTARKRDATLVGGTSFGLDTTRIYLTAVRTSTTTPFIRIAPGLESKEDLHLVAQALIHAITKL